MPELPEVETIRRGLSKRIIGRRIISLYFDWAKSFQGDKSMVEGQEIVNIERRAKTIRIKLKNAYSLLFHLKMTGQLIYREQSAVGSKQSAAKTTVDKLQTANYFAGGHPDHDWHAELPNKHTRIAFNLDDNSTLYFNDLRKFGWCKVMTEQEVQDFYAKSYGLEPLLLIDNLIGKVNPEFNVEYLQEKASRIPNRNIKQFLLDQTIVTGIGNIYADEILFDVQILPTRKVKDISINEWQKIIESTVKILNLAINHGGTTDSDYVNADGEKGGMQDYLKVYHKDGSRCAGKCGGFVLRTTVGGRGTHYCSNCQK
ncbi:MAG: bifunctional DNA-formamidopyrimidine glycosylase/DNA-(apurinic or apyrimidinic site) lyase [bacterium]